MRPVLDRHLGERNTSRFHAHGLKQRRSPFADRAIIPSLDERAVGDRDRVGKIFRRSEHRLCPLLLHREDVLTRLECGVDFQNDIAELRCRSAHVHLQSGECCDFIGKNGSQWLEALIRGDDVGFRRNRHLAAGDFQHFRSRHNQRSILRIQARSQNADQRNQQSGK